MNSKNFNISKIDTKNMKTPNTATYAQHVHIAQCISYVS